MRFRAIELATSLGGELRGSDVEVACVTTDSRSLLGGELFVPIVAERDGHEFIGDALAAGAAAYLTERPPAGGTAIVVADTMSALAAIGRLARDRLRPPQHVVGITGSVGKTTTKDLLAAALATSMVAAASHRSFNNEIGVPLTLANAPDDVDAVVVEMGVRGRGHIRTLCDVARPSIGVVTAVASVHTELFGSIDEVAMGKRELVEALPASGTAVLNADDMLVVAMAGHTAAEVLRYSATGASGADVVATGVSIDGELRPTFTLHTPWGTTDVALDARGLHQVDNALAAAAGVLACGASLDGVADGLARETTSPWRMELVRTADGAAVLNDAYNANPASMAAALRALAALPAERRTAVVGTMAELGTSAAADHREVADLARLLGIRLVAVAESRYGVEEVADVDGAVTWLGPLGEGDAVLVKGSRVAGLEVLAHRLIGGERP